MDKQILNLERARRRVKVIIDSCGEMDNAEYERLRRYISNRYDVSLPYDRPTKPTSQPIKHLT